MVYEGRDFYEKKIETLLCIMVEKLKCENGCGKAAYNKTAETIMCGLLNKMYSYGFWNANTAGRQNFPGIDLISSDRQLGVQITTENSLAKVDHTLQMVSEHEECGSIRRLIILILTFDKPKATMTARKAERWFNGAEDIWTLRKIVTDLQSEATDVMKLKEIAGFLEREIGGVTSEPEGQKLATNSLQPNAPESPEEKETENLDDELEAKFKELCDVPREPENISPLQQKLLERKSRNFMRTIESKLPKDDEEDQNDGIVSLIPNGYGLGNTESESLGKHFTIPDVPGYKTIIFEIYVNIDYKSFTKFYTCEPLDCIQRESSDGIGTETTYYVDDPQEDGNQLVVLHFNDKDNEVMINEGILIDDELLIARKPVYFPLNTLMFDESMDLSTSAYDLDNLSKDELSQITRRNTASEEQWYDANIGDTSIILVDPETAMPVKRELYYDTDSKKWRARIKIALCKSYFSFQIRCGDENSVKVSLAELEIAKYYKDGLFGFPRDVVKAAEYFEKDGSAEALYEIADIFRTDPAVQDRDAYLEYMHQAIERGCEDAAVELIADMLLSEGAYDPSELEKLLEKTEGENNIINFLLGYATEKGLWPGTADVAFSYYHRAAVGGYKPARARLGMAKMGNAEEELLRRRFLQTLDDTCFVPEYCMGCVLFFGLGIRPRKESGIALLEVAAQNGNKQAMDALYQIYDSDDEYEDKEKALTWLKLIEKDDPSLSNVLANRLIDGIGCEISNDNDRLAFEILQKASRTGDKTAIHNLGWMYKNGRGCETNYVEALRLLMEAEKPGSFYHIGDMYERGLGVDADVSIAVQYYERGAAQGSQKAIKRLEELKQGVAQ